MSRADKSKLRPVRSHYDANYEGFQTELYAQIRQDAFGEDIGQNSWLTAEEQDLFLSWLDLSTGKTLLDVACGSGGPGLRIAGSTGRSLVGIDIHDRLSQLQSHWHLSGTFKDGLSFT